MALEVGLEEGFETLIFLFQIIGGLLGIYIIFWGINAYLNSKKFKLLNKILTRLDELEKKIDKLSSKK